MIKKSTRGVRNNNPGNIERNSTKWQGMADDQSGDVRFIVFKTPEWGIRALARVLLTYQNAHSLKTLRKIINRWAPPVENDTAAYVAAVARSVGVSADEVIDVDQMEVMLPLVKAVIAHENAGYAYPDVVVLEGIRRAGVADAKPKPLMKEKTFVAQAATGIAVTGAGFCRQWRSPGGARHPFLAVSPSALLAPPMARGAFPREEGPCCDRTTQV